MMPDDLKLHQKAARGSRAKLLLENELLAQAYDDIEKSLIEVWAASEPRDTDGRERLWHSLQANRRHKQLLQMHIANGAIAQKEIDQLHAEAERKKKFGIL